MIKKIVLIAIVIIGLVIAYNLINRIIEATKSGDRLSEAANTVYKLEAKNKELKEKLARIKSVEFVEQQARDKLGLGKKGETLVIIPEETLRLVLGASSSAKEARLPNWQGWLSLFWHKF